MQESASQIRKARERKRFTQQQVADRVGVTNVAVSRWENGLDLPEPTKAKQLSEILGISLEKIYEAA